MTKSRCPIAHCFTGTYNCQNPIRTNIGRGAGRRVAHGRSTCDGHVSRDCQMPTPLISSWRYAVELLITRGKFGTTFVLPRCVFFGLMGFVWQKIGSSLEITSEVGYLVVRILQRRCYIYCVVVSRNCQKRELHAT